MGSFRKTQLRRTAEVNRNSLTTSRENAIEEPKDATKIDEKAGEYLIAGILFA